MFVLYLAFIELMTPFNFAVLLRRKSQ